MVGRSRSGGGDARSLVLKTTCTLSRRLHFQPLSGAASSFHPHKVTTSLLGKRKETAQTQIKHLLRDALGSGDTEDQGSGSTGRRYRLIFFTRPLAAQQPSLMPAQREISWHQEDGHTGAGIHTWACWNLN